MSAMSLDGVVNDDWHHAAVVALTGLTSLLQRLPVVCPRNSFLRQVCYLYQGHRIRQEAPRGYPSLS